MRISSVCSSTFRIVILMAFAVLAAASGLGPIGASQDSQPVERPVVTGSGIAEVDLETALERFVGNVEASCEDPQRITWRDENTNASSPTSFASSKMLW